MEETRKNSNGGEEKTEKGTRRKLLLKLALLFVMAGGVWAYYWDRYGQYREFTDNAYVSGNLVSVAPQTAGTVVAVNIDDTDYVEKGQVVVRLGDTDATIALDAAKAALAASVRNVARLAIQVEQVAAAVAIKEAELEKAADEYERRKELRESRAVSDEDFKRSRSALDMAQSSLSLARARLEEAKIQAGDGDIENHPDVRLAVARYREAYANRNRMLIMAPVSGYVAKRSVQVGEQVAPGKPLMAIVPLNQIWVEANFKESQLRHMRVGQPVTLTSDVYGSEDVYNGKVAGIGAGTGAVFSLLPAQNATGNWIKVVQRTPVRI